MKISAILLLIVLSLAGCDMSDSQSGTQNLSLNFSSNGERIYLTGTSASGQPVTANSNDSPMGMGMQMHGGSCATCHGNDKSGKRLFPRFWITAPALTAHALFDKADHDDEHGDHGVYDSDSLRLAITEGIDPGQSELHPAMPRWSMSESDLSDLIAYLMQRDGH